MTHVLFKTSIMTTAAILVALSCSKETTPIIPAQNDLHTCHMKLVGDKTEYDQLGTKAGESTRWDDGSTIYLRMNSPMGITLGTAIYEKSTDVWTVCYHGSLYEDVANSCAAIYFEDFQISDNKVVTLNENTAVFEDQHGSYIFTGGDLVVTANLKPKTGRIHLQGEIGTTVKVYGITHYTTYDVNTNSFTSTLSEFKTTVEADGFTPYFYGYFTEVDEPCIRLWIDAKEAYSRFLSTSIFKPGESGKLTIPTLDSFVGWSDGLVFNVNGEKFKMIAVEGGSFIMGDPNSTSEYYTTHKVTLTGFCIQETEYYNRLAGKVSNNTSYSNLKPFVNVYRSRILSDIDQLSLKTGALFSLPTEAQWEFAARGGTRSLGFNYCGGNTMDQVGWVQSNSNGVTHDIKGKLPNELGLYDMTGNVYEMVLDYYAVFSSNSVVDPIVNSAAPGYQLYVTRGGSFGSGNHVTALYRSGFNAGNYASDLGFRIALNW